MYLARRNKDFFPRGFGHMMDNFFDEKVNNSFVPKVDIKETDKSFEIQVALPGLKKDEIKVDIDERTMTISGERKMEKKEDKENYHMVETQYGSFSRSFNVPKSVSMDKIDAKFEDGILNVVLPKDEKATLSKTLEVK